MLHTGLPHNGLVRIAEVQSAFGKELLEPVTRDSFETGSSHLRLLELVLVHLTPGIDPLTVHLELSPGDIETIVIISDVDVVLPQILAQQLLYLMYIGPSIVKVITSEGAQLSANLRIRQSIAQRVSWRGLFK
jgi:hypothetical protein